MRLTVPNAVVVLGVVLLLGLTGGGPALASSVDRGFVFFDGVYLDAPYVVEARDLAVHINGVRVTKPMEWPPLQDYMFDHDPGFPEGLTRESTLDEALGVREPGGVLLDAAKQWYLFSHFRYDEALEQMEEYYSSLPCVKSFHKEENGLWILESYRGERQRLVMGHGNARFLNEWYGPDGDGPPSLAEYEARVERRRARFINRLGKGDLFLLRSNGSEVSFAERRAAVLLPEMLDALGSSATWETKVDELYSLGAVQRGDTVHARLLTGGYRPSAALDARIAALRSEIRMSHGDEGLLPAARDLDLTARLAKDLAPSAGGHDDRGRGVAYSPDGSSVYGFCGYVYDDAFDGFDGEVAAVGDYVKDQDFNSTLIIYKDTGDEDSDPETATYDNLKQMRYSDLLYLAVHGDKAANGGPLLFVLLESQDDVAEWADDDPMIEDAIDPFTDWPTGHPYFATASSGWATSNWKPMLDQSKAISILSCCFSHENGWAAACGGAVAFGYDVTCTGWGCEDNNEMLLKRMNGSVEDGEHRKAYEAFSDMPTNHHQFRITPANAEATLAPAPETHEPEDDELVDAEGTGHFQVDTYCDASAPAEEALTFETDGDVTISNVHWIGSGKVNRIEFDWSGTGEFEVTVTANADKFGSWGAAINGTHKLDGDGEDPNGDDYEFSFKSRPKSVLFVIDDTGSMWDEIASVRVALHNLIDSFEASGERILYTLVTFKDYVDYRGQTEDHGTIRSWVSALYADGGGDCPEESCDALLVGAGAAPHSEAWWMTDADAHGGWARMAYVRTVLWLSGVRLHSVIMGSCAYDALGRTLCTTDRSGNDPTDVCALSDGRDQVNSYAAARYLSEGTGGLYFAVSSSEVCDATEICLEEMTRTTAVACAYDCTGEKSIDVPLDGSVIQARFLVNPMTGAYPSIAVRNPSGVEIDETYEGVTLMTAGGTEYLIVEPPTVTEGTWTVGISGTSGDYAMRCALDTPVTFEYLGETSCAVGAPLDVVIDFDGTYPTSSFSMVSVDGEVEHALDLFDDGIHGDGGPGDGTYGGTFTASEGGTYRIKATAGVDFCRMDPAKIYFGEMAATASGDRYATPGDTLIHSLSVQNLSDQTETYNLEFSSSAGWAEISGLPTSVAVESDSSFVTHIIVRVPVTAINGEVDELTLSAAQESDPLVSASATARTVAWSGPLIGSVAPAVVSRGEVVTITGASFGDDPGPGNRATEENNVTIGSVRVADDGIVTWSPGTIEACVPTAVQSGEQTLYVTAGGIASSPSELAISEGEVGLSNENVFFFPNPYDPEQDEGRISYSLARDGNVTVRILDSTGHEIMTLVEDEPRSGRARHLDPWDGTDAGGDAVANGVYFYIIEADDGEKAVGTIAVLR